MTDPPSTLLSMKYAAPPTPRHGFIARLDLAGAVAAARGVVLVCAPAGYGKTTFVAQVAGERLAGCAWLTLDEGDNDPAVFGAYLLAAVAAVIPGARDEMATLTSTASMAPLLNAIAAHREPVTIVLDDYHAITGAAVHGMTAFLARHLPAHARLVIATRHDPPLPLATLRGRGLLTEIRAADLRFDVDATRRYLEEAMGLDLSRPAIEMLTQRTEGWVAGLQLAGLSLRRSPDPEAFVHAFGATDRYIFDYLTDEVLATQSDDVRSFLEATCILGRLRADLCDAVTRRDDGAAMLASLSASSLFLSAIDDGGEWFRYHRLFADLVASTLEAPRRQELHRRAAAWFAANKLPVEAIRHALAADDAEGAAAMIEQAAEHTLARGETTTVLAWCGALPEAVIESHPELIVQRAWATFITGDIAGAEQLLAAAPGMHGMSDRTAARRACLEAWFANRHDWPQAESLARVALERTSESDPVFRSLAFTTLGESIVGRDVRAGVQAFEQARRLALTSGRSALLGGAIYSLANTYIIEGRRSESEALCRRTIADVTAGGRATPAWLGVIHLPLGTALFEANELSQARQHIATGQELCERARLRITMLGASEWYEVLVLHLLGERDLAWRRLEAIRREAHHVGVERVALAMSLLAAELLLLEGDIAGARATIEAAPPVDPAVLGTVRDRRELTTARVLVAAGRAADGLAILRALADEQRAGGRLGRLIPTLTSLAAASARSHDAEGASRALSEAVTLAGGERYTRAFVDSVLPVAELLPSVRHLSPAFVDDLLVSRGNGAHRTPIGARGTGGLVEPLSVRELEVLQLVAAGLSNEEIGRSIFVSPGTAKWHVHNLLGKVGARNRVGLVAEARALGLL